jgi:hypothetical protein
MTFAKLFSDNFRQLLSMIRSRRGFALSILGALGLLARADFGGGDPAFS